MEIKSIFVDRLGIIIVGNPNLYVSAYDKICYEMNTGMYQCFRNTKIVAEYNARYVIRVEYE